MKVRISHLCLDIEIRNRTLFFVTMLNLGEQSSSIKKRGNDRRIEIGVFVPRRCARSTVPRCALTFTPITLVTIALVSFQVSLSCSLFPLILQSSRRIRPFMSSGRSPRATACCCTLTIFRWEIVVDELAADNLARERSTESTLASSEFTRPSSPALRV